MLHIVFQCPVTIFVVRVRYGQVFGDLRFFGTACRGEAPPCPTTRTRCDRRFPDFPGDCARGGVYAFFICCCQALHVFLNQKCMFCNAGSRYTRFMTKGRTVQVLPLRLWQGGRAGALPALCTPSCARSLAFGRNQWPSDPPQFKAVALRYVAMLLQLGAKLMEAIARGLDLPADHFTPSMDRSFWILRTIYYPQQAGPEAPGQGCGEHTDYGFLTLLVDDGPPGCLQVQLLDGSWVGVDRPPGSFVCNIGDMLMQATGGRYRATPHRVVAPAAGPRGSVAFFFEPNFDAAVRAVATGAAEGLPPAPYGHHLLAKVSTNFDFTQ